MNNFEVFNLGFGARMWMMLRTDSAGGESDSILSLTIVPEPVENLKLLHTGYH